MRYWGPLASRKSSDWIVAATRFVMRTPDLAPNVLFSYLPHLDYDLQRHGPESKEALIALETAYDCLDALRVDAEANGYEFLFFGDYAIEQVSRGAVFLNRRLRDAGLFFPRYVKGRAYADFWRSRAFAMADHQIAHVFASDQTSIQQARAALEKLPGVGEILDRAAQHRVGVAHARGGELLLVAAEGFWFAYPWWDDTKEAPDYASHVDIHNKPGYDPCELFFGWPPWKVCQDPARVRGSHGRSGTGNAVAWLSSFHKEPRPASLLDLARSVQERLESG
jgi:predicted AlkP superfamily pyrophosphatase or phosphodiesterase